MITRRRFVQGSALATFLQFQQKAVAMDEDMKARIAKIIRDYSQQGDHRSGSDVDDASADWLATQIKSLGVEPIESSFLFNRVSVIEAALTFGERKVIGVPLFDCRFTDERGIRGSMGEVGSDADIGVAMSLPFASSPSGQSIHAARLNDKHKAIIIVTDDSLPADGVATLNAEDFNKPFGPPVLQVPSHYWPEMQTAMSVGAEAEVVVHVEYIEANARSIGARIKGTQTELAPLVIMTPRSGWWRCASERGGGIACLLEMMRGIREKGAIRDVIFTANTGHELGHTGLDQYLDDNRELIREASIWIHLGANFAAKYGPGVRLQFSDKEARKVLEPFLDTNFLKPASETDVGHRPLGEARNIHDGGGRYISILGRNGLFHHPADVWPDAVNLEATTRWVNAFVQLGVKLSS
jgi:hypothetical protein